MKLYLLNSNWERVWTTAASEGLSHTEAINRAIAFYDEVHRMHPPQKVGRFIRRQSIATMSWVDGEGLRRRIARIE